MSKMVRNRNLSVLACRVCLSPEKNNIIMDTTNGWLELFNYCFGLEIHPREQARALCEQCADSLKSFSLLKLKCWESDDVWKQRLKAPQFEMNLRHDKVTKEVEQEKLSSEPKDLEENNIEELNLENNTILINSESDCSIEQEVDILRDDDDNDQNISYDYNYANVEKYNDKVTINQQMNPQKQPTTNYGRNDKKVEKWKDKITSNPQLIVLQKRPSTNYNNNDKKCGIQVLSNVQLTNIKKQPTTSYGNNDKKVENIIDKITSNPHLTVLNKKPTMSYANDDGVKNCEDKLSSNLQATNLLKQATNLQQVAKKRVYFNKPKMPCGCGIQYIYHEAKHRKHIRECGVLKFYDLPENQDGVMKTCGLCHYSTPSVNDLRKHFGEHDTRNDLDCKLCNFSGVDFAEMAYHRYEHMPPDRLKLHCLKCLRLFGCPKRLQFHFRRIHLKQEKGGLCPCGSRFVTFKGWIRHEKAQHSDPKEVKEVFICNCCEIRFNHRSKLLYHLRTQARSDLDTHVCEKCGAKFMTIKSLKSHTLNMHAFKLVKCTICSRDIKDHQLVCHLKNAHGDKNYVCEFCSEAFITRNNLKNHMLKHTNQRPYQCDLCDANYKNKRALTLHIKRHSGEKPHVCSVCFKRFFLIRQLQIHMSVHGYKRRFQCEKCHRSFHEKKRRMEHYVKVHPELVLPEQ